jgi:MFS family permease
MVGYISSLYYLSQLAGGVAVGALSDIIPRRDVLLLSFAGSAISYYIVGHTHQLWILFASRAVVGLVKQTMTISTSIVSERADMHSRAANIAHLSASNTLAFIIGPSIGSILYKKDPRLPAIASASLFIANMFICYFRIPRQNPGNAGSRRPSEIKEGNSNSADLGVLNKLKELCASAQSGGLLVHLLALFCINFIDRAMSVNNMVSYFENRYGVESYTLGFIASATSAMAFLAQTFLVKRAKVVCGSERRAIVCGLVLHGLAYFSECFCTSIYHYLFLVVPLSVTASNIVSACSKSALSETVHAAHVGKMFGALNILEAVAGVSAPIYGSEVFTRVGYFGRSITAAIHYALLSSFVILLFMRDMREEPSQR